MKDLLFQLQLYSNPVKKQKTKNFTSPHDLISLEASSENVIKTFRKSK